MSNDDKDFPEKWLKKLPTGFTDTVETMSEGELKAQVLKSESNIADVEKEMESDQKLIALKEDLKVLASAYKDVINTEKAKTRYCLHVMRLRGLR